MHKVVSFFAVFGFLFAVNIANAQVISQNQLILPPLGNNGFVVSTSTAFGAKLSASSSPFFATFSFGLATGTAATTTNSFSTTASSTNLFSTVFNTGIAFFNGLATMANLLVNGSSTLQNFTAVNSTSTSATTTNSFATTASSTNLFSTSLYTGNASSTGMLNVGGGATIYASTTIGGGGVFSGLTISGNATGTTFRATSAGTVGNAAVSVSDGKIGIYSGAAATLSFTNGVNGFSWNGTALYPNTNVVRNLGINGTNEWNAIFVTNASSTNATSTNATSTTLFSTIASSTNLFSTNAGIGALTVNNSFITPFVNDIIFLDGTRYPKTLVGAQAALDFLDGLGGGTLILPANITLTVTSAPLTVGNNTRLIGQGSSTVIKLGNSSTITTNSVVTNKNQSTGASGIEIGNLRVEGNRANNLTLDYSDIYFNNVRQSSIHDVTANEANRGSSAFGEGIRVASSTLISVTNVVVERNDYDGVKFFNGTATSTINGVIGRNNGTAVVQIALNSQNNTVTNITGYHTTGTPGSHSNQTSCIVTHASSNNSFSNFNCWGTQEGIGQLNTPPSKTSGNTFTNGYLGVRQNASGFGAISVRDVDRDVGTSTFSNITIEGIAGANGRYLDLESTAGGNNTFSNISYRLNGGTGTWTIVNDSPFNRFFNNYFENASLASNAGNFSELSGNTGLMTGFLTTAASSTFQNFTAVNSTSSKATSTNSFATTASSTNLFSAIANIGLATFNSLATFTRGFISQASSTIGAGTIRTGLTVNGAATTSQTRALGGVAGIIAYFGDNVSTNAAPIVYSYKTGASSGAAAVLGFNSYIDQGGASRVVNANSNGYQWKMDNRDFAGADNAGMSFHMIKRDGTDYTPWAMDSAGHIVYGNNASSPSINSCGTAAAIIGGTDNNFIVKAGSTGPTSCTINFGASWNNPPVCTASAGTALSTAVGASSTVSTVVLTFASGITSKNVNVICMGY